MVFEYPNFLYALILLAVPLMVHLFQFRKFKRIPFSNVQFLQKIESQTRRSKSIKKWLLLASRSLLLLCLILAFAQPKWKKYDPEIITEHIIVLDNSLSMSVKNDGTSLMKAAIQDLIAVLPEDQNISFYTIDQAFPKTSLNAIRNDLFEIGYSPKTFDLTYVASQFDMDQVNEKATSIIIISDFQQGNSFKALDSTELQLSLVKLSPRSTKNISVDSLYIKNRTLETLTLGCRVSSKTKESSPIPVELYVNDALDAKSFYNGGEEEITFVLEERGAFSGYISINEPNLLFDNKLYFSIQVLDKPKILSLSNGDSGYLRRIFTDDEFDFESQLASQLDFAALDGVDLLILNELEQINSNLEARLRRFVKDGGRIALIPHANGAIDSYNAILGQPLYMAKTPSTGKPVAISKVHTKHPVFNEVFESEVKNFQYPTYISNFTINPILGRILSDAEGLPFTVGTTQLVCFAGPLSDAYSNFTSSPLIVPLFYNFGFKSQNHELLYQTIGKPIGIEVYTDEQSENPIVIENEYDAFIPLQSQNRRAISLNLRNEVQKAGNYQVRKDRAVLKSLSFNFDRRENQLIYMTDEELSGYTVYEETTAALDSLKKERENGGLWKWFLIFALVFLGSEWLILKFMK